MKPLERTAGYAIHSEGSQLMDGATQGMSDFNQSQHYGSFMGSHGTFKTCDQLIFEDKDLKKKKIQKTNFMKEYDRN